MSSENVCLKSLCRQLQNARERSESKMFFIPDIRIDGILTRPAVEEATAELKCQPDESIGLSQAIWERGKKTFAILILMGEHDYIVKFREHATLDSQLPLTEEDAKRIASDVGVRFATQYQWELLPQTFPRRMWEHHLEFHNDRILPFVGAAENLAEGGFGHISKVSILASQQQIFPLQTGEDRITLVRKKLKSTQVTKFVAQEKACLRLLNQLQHPNIIRLIGSYTQESEHNFLFPLHDMDLATFFRQERRYGNFKYDFTFFSALRGLSSALAVTHQLHLNQKDHGLEFEAIGYHHDFRPKNILVSKDTFILADFGLGNMKSIDSWSMTPFKNTPGDYIAPECRDKNFKSQDINRAIDVWAFGCLVADTATYMKNGPKGIRDFSDNRVAPGRNPKWSDSDFGGPDGNIKDQCKEWLKDIVERSPPNDPIELLTRLSMDILIGDPTQRLKMSDVCSRLTLYSLKAHSLAIRAEFSHFASISSVDVHKNNTPQNLWLFRERFHAWNHILGLEDEQSSPNASLDTIYDTSIVNIIKLHHALQKGVNFIDSEDIDPRSTFESEIDSYIEKLWSLLPETLKVPAENYWRQCILSTDDQNVLDSVPRSLKSRYVAYDIVSAMAMMKKYRLKLLRPDSLESADDPCVIVRGDIDFPTDDKGHKFGKYQGKELILVERIEYLNSLEGVSPAQQKLVVGLKAKGLSASPRPDSLRTLQCIGAFEEKTGGDKVGYGLVYIYPNPTESETTTLEQILRNEYKLSSKDYPLLGARFKLAFSLADFLKEFHTIGWLHENFNSHNVLFFKSSDGHYHSKLEKPYIVGLHKSRPDGSFWQTDGHQSGDGSKENYQHPGYLGVRRYRQSFDYYSLGIVLLEIGLWCPLSKLLSDKKYMTATLAEISKALALLCQERLGPKMGAAYRNVVEKCMDGSLEGHEHQNVSFVKSETPTERTATLGRFTSAVVEPLRKLSMVV